MYQDRFLANFLLTFKWIRRRAIQFLLVAATCSSAVASDHELSFAWPVDLGPLNPHLYAPNQMFAQSMVFEPLVKYRSDGSTVPWLARSWTVSEDGRTYRFNLRDDVRFSNGEQFTAHTVQENFRAVLDNIDRHRWLELANQIRRFEAIDDYTFELELKNPYYPILQELALARPFRFIAPSQFVDGGTKKGIKAPVGTGPWKLVQSNLGQDYRFERNEGYWGDKPAYGAVKVKILPDPNSRSIAFETGQIDFLYGTSGPISPDSYERFSKKPELSVQLSAPYQTLAFALNSSRGPTADLSVRKAINHAVNKDLIVQTILHGTQKKADTLFASNVPYADIHLQPYKFDPELAERMLEAAGWTRSAAGAIRVRDGVPLEIDLAFIGNDPVSRSIAEVVQADLAKVGIAITLIGEEESSIYARQRDGRFGMIFNRTWGAPYDPHAFVSSMRFPTHADYQAQLGLPSKKHIDALIDEVLSSTDEQQRRAIYRSILSELHEQAVYLPLTYITAMALARPGISNISFGAMASDIPFETLQPAPE